MTVLLPADALTGIRVGISVSESPDLARLGLLEDHFRLALGEITRAVVTAGGSLIYGGYLLPDGYTAFMVAELHRYSRRDRPLLICLPWQEHRSRPLTELRRFQQQLSLFGQLVCLDPTGAEMDPTAGRGDAPAPVTDPDLRQQALTSMRDYMRERQSGRVLLGGRRSGFDGSLPGLLEEALVTIESGRPLYLAAGFGGITMDIVRALEIDDATWLPPADESPPEPPLAEGFARLSRLARSGTWAGPDNGLSTDENRKLAATHRPSDIATLVSLGLGRRARPPASD